MNIFTVTYLHKNYGSALQAYALQSKLREFNVNAYVIIKKQPSKYSKLYNKLASFFRLLKPKENYSLLQRIILLRDENKYRQKFSKIDYFINSRINILKIKDEIRFLSEINHTDVFVAGSDQIWNRSDPMPIWYSLQWVSSKNKKYSYAASIGRASLNNNQIKSYVNSLSDFDTISLRETQALTLFSPYFGNKLRQDIDPTLLYDGLFWAKMASPRIIKDPYVFVYRLRPDKDVLDFAKKVENDLGIKLIYTGLYASHSKEIETVYDAGVEDFLSMILHAEAVVTNSFHGTVFSILFNRPFLSFSVKTTGSRVESLLEQLKLESQIVRNVNDDYSLDIDYSNVNITLSKKRIESIKYLEKICRQSKVL